MYPLRLNRFKSLTLLDSTTENNILKVDNTKMYEQ